MYSLDKALSSSIYNIMCNGIIADNKKDSTIFLNNDIIEFDCDSVISIPYRIIFNKNLDRKLGLKFGLAEAAYILEGRDDSNFAIDFPFMSKFLKDNIMVGSYGPYFDKQFTDAIKLLQNDINTRQAVIVVWPIDDPSRRGPLCSDVPCTNYFAFYASCDRLGKLRLNLTVVHRSSDMLAGLMYDVVFQQILLYITCILVNIEHVDIIYPGKIMNVAINRHIYLDSHGVFALKKSFIKAYNGYATVELNSFNLTRFISEHVFETSDITTYVGVRNLLKNIPILNFKEVIKKISHHLYDSVINDSYKKYLYGGQDAKIYKY